jgi:hypothetical protein
LKTSILALAATLVMIVGGPAISFAQGSGGESSSETRFRKLVVEPKGLVASPAPIESPAVVTPKIALPAEGIETAKGSGDGTGGGDGKGQKKPERIIVQPEVEPAPKEIIVKADPKLTAPPAVEDDLFELLDETPAAKSAPPKIIVEKPLKEVAPAPTAKVEEEDSVVGAAQLYDVLKSKGYDVKVEKGSEYGQYVFYVTKEGYEYSNLLIVDGEYGKVLKRQKTKLAKAYKAPKTYEDSYEEPAYEEPAYEKPRYKAPAYKAPAYEAPAYEDDGYGNDSHGNSGSSGY